MSSYETHSLSPLAALGVLALLMCCYFPLSKAECADFCNKNCTALIEPEAEQCYGAKERCNCINEAAKGRFSSTTFGSSQSTTQSETKGSGYYTGSSQGGSYSGTSHWESQSQTNRQSSGSSTTTYSGGGSTGIVIGGVVGVIILICCIGGCIYCCTRANTNRGHNAYPVYSGQAGVMPYPAYNAPVAPIIAPTHMY